MDAMKELQKWSKETGYFSWAAKHARRALELVERGEAMIVPCTWSDIDLPGYNAVCAADWEAVRGTPADAFVDWQIEFAEFSPNAPGAVGKTYKGDRASWVVIRGWTQAELDDMEAS